MDAFQPDYDAVGDYHSEEVAIPFDSPSPNPESTTTDPETAQFIRDLQHATRPTGPDTMPTWDWLNGNDNGQDYDDEY